MKCVIQRVLSAKLSINNNETCSIERGLVVLIGYNSQDDAKNIDYIIEKLINLRLFQDENDKMNLSLKDVNGEIMLVPNFTLYADVRKGRRPDFVECASYEISKPLFEKSVEKLFKIYSKSCSGVFGADMQINLINDGPVTIILEK